MARACCLCVGGLAVTWVLGIAALMGLLIYGPDIDDVFWTGD